MHLAELLTRDRIQPAIKGRDRRAVLKELTAIALPRARDKVRDRAVHALLEREALGSTAVGDGVAIPHAKVPGVEQMCAAFGRRDAGIDFQAEDTEPVDLFFLLLVPEKTASTHLKVLAQIARLVRDAQTQHRLRTAASAAQLHAILAEATADAA